MKLKAGLGILVLLFLNVLTTFAQASGDPGEPCAGTDPDSDCPLDNWIIVLVVVSVLIAAWHLSRKRRVTV